jgi:uncharacterized protein (DUF2141 family)
MMKRMTTKILRAAKGALVVLSAARQVAAGDVTITL